MRFIPQSATVKVPAERFIPRDHQKRKARSEEHTSELQSQSNLVCRLLLEKKKKIHILLNFYAVSHHSLHQQHKCVCRERYANSILPFPIHHSIEYMSRYMHQLEHYRTIK